MHATTVAAYAYQAELLCPEDAAGALTRVRGAYDRDPHKAIRQIATRDRVDISDESSYDSDDFPKVVFASDLDEGDTCGACGAELLDA